MNVDGRHRTPVSLLRADDDSARAGSAQLRQHRDFIAGIELVAFHAHAPHLFPRRHLRLYAEAEFGEELGDVGQRHDATQADVAGFVEQALDEYAAETFAFVGIVHDERTHFAQVFGEVSRTPQAATRPFISITKKSRRWRYNSLMVRGSRLPCAA